jgi:hypothetical protein
MGRMQRRGAGSTYTGDAVLEGLRVLDAAPCGDTQVLDIVSDGVPNGGAPLAEARDAAHAAGVRINVLLVAGTDAEADRLRDEAVTPGGFLMRAGSWGEFARAVARKLVTEIGAR